MKIKFLIVALFFSLVAAAQPSNYIKFNTRGRWIAGMFDSTLHVPRFNGSPSLRTGGSSMDGAIAIDTTNGVFYFYQGGSWKRANLDTSAYAVTSVYRKTASDSVFYVKGGVHTFAFKDSTGGGTPTLQQVLTAGSTLTEDGSIILDGNNIEFQGNNSEVFNILAVNSFGVTTQEGSRVNISTGAGSLIVSGTRISRSSRIEILPDSIRVMPGSGNLFIDTLTSAVGTKALRYNPTTGLVTYADTTTGGSGGTPAGSTKQIQYNNAGSFGGAAGFEYQSGSSPNVTITGQNAAHVPLYVKGIGSTQTADLFRVMRYDDSAMFRIAANGSVTLGPPYDYVNAHHAPGHEFKYSNGGYTGGIKLRNLSSGSIVRLHTVNNGLYITDDAGSATPMTLGTRTNPADASTFIAASGLWTISAGRFGVGGTADASAIIAATSTTKGFLPPKMTGTQAEAISSPAEGLLVYATDGSGSTITSKGWWGYDGAAWVKLN